MTDIRPNPGSFRDPSGRIYHRGDKVYRTVTDHGAAEFEFVRASGLIDRLVADGMLLPGEVVAPDILGEYGRDARYVIEHPRLPFISYPYEWPFPALKAAAMLHIGVHLAALEHGVTLSDASAYNVQFRGTTPVFIDLLSLRRYRDGEFWARAPAILRTVPQSLVAAEQTWHPPQWLVPGNAGGHRRCRDQPAIAVA